MLHRKLLLIFLLLVLKLIWVESLPLKFEEKTCQNCHPLDAVKTNIHLVPHSHDDVGWLKTVKQYYEGTGDFSSNHDAGVKFILDSTIEALQKNKERRFIQVETAFFWKWWQDQENATKTIVRNLVDNGQLEMINGAWSMNDEAATNYQSIIDQFTWGFHILNKHLGQCGQPSVGWQIDPFGHSKEHAWLMKQFGFEGLFLGRIDVADKDKRDAEHDLDFLWKSSASFEDSEIFTSILPNMYTYEKYFCFDSTCPSQDKITDGNKMQKVNQFVPLLDKYRNYYKTRNVLIPMGGDFTFQKAEENFGSIDKLIEGFRNHETYNVFYSTPTCYIRAVLEEREKEYKKINLSQKNDDFFPYASDQNSYWTGYYTSRPTLKRFERIGNNILQSVKQLMTFSRIKNFTRNDEKINLLREAMGILQHHDAITGTAKQAVTDDYSKILHKAIKQAEEPIGAIIGNLLKKEDAESIDLQLSTCLLSNVSICQPSQEKRFLVVIHNPLSKTISHYVHLPVTAIGQSFRITGPFGEEEYDLFDAPHNFDFVNEEFQADKELVFLAKNLPPLGIRVYYIEKIDFGSNNSYQPFNECLQTDSGFFGDQNSGFSYNKDTNLLESVSINKIEQKISQEFLYYTGNSGSPRSSGAYVFKPKLNSTNKINAENVRCERAVGQFVENFRQIINWEVSQVIRVYKNKPYIEFDWLVGGLERGKNGKEVITRFTLEDFNNDGVFYTDSNGRQLIKRERNKRDTFTYDATTEPISSNYYPVTSRILIKDESKNLTVAVLNDRSQGGSSLEDGTIELMVHRRLFSDDGFGVDEPLDEKQYGVGLYARGRHFLTFGSTQSKILAQEKLQEPWILVGSTSDSLETIQKKINFEFKGLSAPLPKNVKILTLEPWENSYILRLENFLEKDESPSETTVNLKNAFPLFNIVQILETPLGANVVENNWKNATDDLLNITLKPYEIKTFLIKTDRNNEGGNVDNCNNDDDNDDDGKGNASALRAAVMLIFYLSTLYILF